MRSMECAPVPEIPDGIDVPEDALRQDGVFTRSQARAAGWGDRAQRRLIRQGIWVPVAGSVLRHQAVEPGPWQLARAVHLTGGLVASHATAGLLWRLTVPAAPHGTGHIERRPSGVWVHRIPLTRGDVLSTRGLKVTSPDRTLRDLLCSLREDVGVEMLGCIPAGPADGRRRRQRHPPRARAVRGHHGPRLADSCRREPHSVLEWRFHRLCGSSARVAVQRRHPRRTRLRRPSRCPARGYRDDRRARQPAVHGEDRFQTDRTRDQRLAALGFVVIRLTWDDVERRPMEIVERIRRTVAVRGRAVRKPIPTRPGPNPQPGPRPAA